ncbi:MAG TPA: hypothetical protein VEO54_15425 [Thermoanaerobaculia bacterium]|nr:hypothetical protein [Thermoanaerobaculia bacterium]
MRKVFGILGIVVGIGGLIGIVLERRAAQQRQERLRALTLREETRPFAPGDRVRIVKRAGTFKPSETGADEVVAGPGQTGVVLRWEKRQRDVELGIDPAHEPLQIVRVRWAAQRWKVWGLGDRSVELPEFETTIHVSYLQVERRRPAG